MTEAWQNKWQPLPGGAPLQGATQGMPATLLVAWTCAHSCLLAEYCVARNIFKCGLAGVLLSCLMQRDMPGQVLKTAGIIRSSCWAVGVFQRMNFPMGTCLWPMPQTAYSLLYML